MANTTMAQNGIKYRVVVTGACGNGTSLAGTVTSNSTPTVGSDGVPAQDRLFGGGPLTAPGYGFHEFRGNGLATMHLEVRRPARSVAIPLGRWGRVPPSLTLAPYVGAVGIRGRDGSDAREGVFTYVGIGAISLFELLRFDVARGLRDGRWRFSVDLSRDFWSIL